jgi:hypothetical protein
LKQCAENFIQKSNELGQAYKNAAASLQNRNTAGQTTANTV